MEDLFNEISIEATPAIIGAVVAVVGLVALFKVAKAVVKLLMLAVVLVGAYLFFYGGNLTS